MGTSIVSRRAGECGGVVPAARCEFGRHNEPLGIHSDVQLPPIPAFLRCLVLVRVPFAATQNLEPCGINDQVDRAVVGSAQGRHRNDLVPARECGVVRGLEVEAHQAEQRVQEPLGLAKRQPKTTRSVNAVRTARFEYRRWPPRRLFFGATHAAIASSLSQIVTSPRLLRPRSYSLQFRILYFFWYWRLTRLDFAATTTLPPRSP